MIPRLVATGVPVIWRAHIGLDMPNEIARAAWRFLIPYVERANAYVFSRPTYAWDGLDPAKLTVIAPSIDAFSPKNQAMAFTGVTAVLRAAGLAADHHHPSRAVFERLDGSRGSVQRSATMIEEQTLGLDTPLVAQVSRWDRLKDPLGVLAGFVEHVRADEDPHLVLAGPDVTAVADDPEGAEVLAEVEAAWRDLPRGARRRVHLALLPMEDPDENAVIVGRASTAVAGLVSRHSARGELIAFFALAYGVSWTYWLLAGAADPDWSYYPGLFGPAVAAGLITAATVGRRGLADLASRALTWRARGALPVVVVVAPLVIAAVTIAAYGLLGGSIDAGLWHTAGAPGLGPAGFVALTLAAAYGEEIGWRGFALPRLQIRADALAASLRLGALWALWHWPLFVVLDNYAELGAVGLVSWAVSILCASVVFGWLYNTTGGSILAVVALHTTVNLVTATDGASVVTIVIVNAGVILVALAVPRLFGRVDLAPRPRQTIPDSES